MVSKQLKMIFIIAAMLIAVAFCISISIRMRPGAMAIEPGWRVFSNNGFEVFVGRDNGDLVYDINEMKIGSLYQYAVISNHIYCCHYGAKPRGLHAGDAMMINDKNVTKYIVIEKSTGNAVVCNQSDIPSDVLWTKL